MNLSRPQFLSYWVKELLRSLNELMFAELRPVPGAHRYCTSVFRSMSTGQMCKTFW